MSNASVVANANGVVGEAAMEGKREGQQLSWRNDCKAGWVVQKFGGTSVGKFAGNIAEDIVRWVLCMGGLQLGEKGSSLTQEANRGFHTGPA